MSYQIDQDSTYLGNDRWSWQVWVEPSADNDLQSIQEVTWFLHHTFPNPVVNKNNRNQKFLLKSSGWGVFQIRAELKMFDGSKIPLAHWLKLAYPKQDRAAATRSSQPETAVKKRKIFLSYGAEDQRLATEIRARLEQRGYDILDPITIQSGLPIEAVTNKMIRDSDLMIGIVTSDLTNPSVFKELHKANSSDKSTLAVINKGLPHPTSLDQNQNRLDLDLGSNDVGNELADFLSKIMP